MIYIPNVDVWYRTLGESAIRTFSGLLRSIAPTEPVLLLGILERGLDDEDKDVSQHNHTFETRMLRDLFGYSKQNQFELVRPDNHARLEYFSALIDYIRKSPKEFPEPANRKRRKLAELPVAPAEESPVKGPTKDDLKAQKKKDRHMLNMLKLNIQFVMDQIRLKYKKFRTPPIEDKDIAYLYDEQNPDVLTTDLSEEQRQQQQLFRPYEVDKDDKGVAGLREVASGKFYYNLEIVTIEKRLSNGYYKRPRDFVADIKRLAKDAKTLGDQERTLKANEMLANVEVDMMKLEQAEPAMVAECEQVYFRDQERERERMQKAREAERRGEEVPKIVPNVPPQQASKTTTESTGPVMLGQEVPGGRPPLFPLTPSRLHRPSPASNQWSMTNGSHPSHQTNGSAVPSRPHEDSEMMDSQADPYELHSQQQHHSPSQPNTQSAFSQRSAHTRLMQGSQVEQYQNSASTTTSGQKTSDKSARSSGPYSVHSNGVPRGDGPDFGQLPEARGGSQLPDTQEQQYSSQSVASQSSQQNMGPPNPPRRENSISALLNNPTEQQLVETEEQSSAPPSRKVLDEGTLDSFLGELVRRSSGLSVEQLEQVNAAMMDVVWKMRGEWNRNQVMYRVQDAFNATIKDIEACQKIMGPSQED